MTEFALRPDGAGPRSGSELLFSNRIAGHFAGIGGVRECMAAEVPLGLPGDRERPRSVSVRRLDRAGVRSGGDLRSSNRPRDCFVGIGVGRSAAAEVPPAGAADRRRLPRRTAAPRLSRPTGPDAAGGDGTATARFDRSPVTPGERRDAPEAAR